MNKDENVHRFALSGEIFERERDREKDSFGIYYTGYLLSIERQEREREIDR